MMMRTLQSEIANKLFNKNFVFSKVQTKIVFYNPNLKLFLSFIEDEEYADLINNLPDDEYQEAYDWNVHKRWIPFITDSFEDAIKYPLGSDLIEDMNDENTIQTINSFVLQKYIAYFSKDDDPNPMLIRTFDS